jgi:hypothetical protein
MAAEIGRIDPDDRFARFPVYASFLDTLATPLDTAAHLRERQFDEFAHRAGLASREHKIARLVRLQYPVHAFDIVPGVAPIAFCVEVSEIERIFEAGLDAGDAARVFRVTKVSPRIAGRRAKPLSRPPSCPAKSSAQQAFRSRRRP